MVNYCSVPGCGRNNRTSKHLFYYGLPKEKARLEQWLRAIGRENLLENNFKKLSYRVCSRHFSPADIKNKHLCADAVPTLCLPTSEWQLWQEEEKPLVHEKITCNSCKRPIIGFRYKCITCPDYDLCSKCEMFEAHSDHYLLRIPKPINYEEKPLVHEKITCNSCKRPIIGFRYKCITCPDYDLCKEEKPLVHEKITCNSCKRPIIGFRYKCITCPDYDLCSKCEMFEAHSDHYLLRIPKPINYKVADDLIKKWQKFVNVEHVNVDALNPDSSSDDDMPIKKYFKQHDCAVDLPEDVKANIGKEVNRVLSIKHIEPKKIKRKRESKKKESNKKKKTEDTKDDVFGVDNYDISQSVVPEVIFADVNDLKDVQLLDIKNEILSVTSTAKEPGQVITDLSLIEADFLLQ